MYIFYENVWVLEVLFHNVWLFTLICDALTIPVALAEQHLQINPLSSRSCSINAAANTLLSLVQTSTMTHRTLAPQNRKVNKHLQKQFIENIRSWCYSLIHDNNIKPSVLHPQCSESWTLWNVDRSYMYQTDVLTRKVVIAPEHIKTKKMRQVCYTLTKEKQRIIKFYLMTNI